MFVPNAVQAAWNSPAKAPPVVVRTTSNVGALPMMHTFGSVTSSTVQRNVRLPGAGPGGIGGGTPTGVGPASVLASKKHPAAPRARHAPPRIPTQRDTSRVLVPIELMRS